MTTPTVDRFLGGITKILREKNGAELQSYLILEPPLPPLYTIIINELRQSFPKKNASALEAKVEKALPADEEGDAGGSWTAFITFLAQYFAFLRDVNIDNLVETHDLLKALLNQSILALSDASMGRVVLSTVISFSRTLARLAIGLDKRPDLVATLTRRESTAGDEDAQERITLVESSANIIREAFKKCLGERSGTSAGLNVEGKPEGRRVGIYLCANICLKLFFHCRKLRSAEQIFSNIYQQSPPLERFPASQRVTFLYYLGRYQFANNHFFRAQLALQSAYNQCHRQCLKQCRSILVYLITSNIVLGRFPSAQLLQRSEAEGFGEKFLPVCQAIRWGDIATFKNLLDLSKPNAQWFLNRRILLQLQNRCEVLVWRSLARKTFLLSGSIGGQSSSGAQLAPTCELKDILVIARLLESQVLRTLNLDTNTRSNAFSKTGLPNGTGDRGVESLKEYVDPDLEGEIETNEPLLPNLQDVEAIAASLIDQDLLHGYISHWHARFVILGAKQKPALQAGFPNVWKTIKSRSSDEVPGWVKEDKSASNRVAKASSGRVINLSGARPAGAIPA